MESTLVVHQGDALTVLETLPDCSVQAIVTSPPYYMQRDYGFDGQIGLEPTVSAYIERLREVFSEAHRVLRRDGTLWLNLGDTWNAYNGNRGSDGQVSRFRSDARPRLPRGYGLTDKSRPNKALLGIPWRVADALSRDGWLLRSEIIWHKPNGTPGGGRDRPASRHETVFMFTRGPRYYTDPELVAWGDVWTIAVGGPASAHPAPMAAQLAKRCIQAGSRPGDTVLDMFHGSGTTGAEAVRLGRDYIGIEGAPAGDVEV